MTPSVQFSGPALSVETCRRRLAPAGLSDGPQAQDLAAEISWHGPAKLDGTLGSEATIQARCGLMHLHGRDQGAPRRIGLEVASVGAGMLAAQGVLAASIGRSRGAAITSVKTSALQASLLLLTHYVAAATGTEQLTLPPGPEPGPPFSSSDGHLFEIETLDPEAWKGFWCEVGAGGSDLGRAWALFRARFYLSSCTLSAGMHKATARHTLAEVTKMAAAHRVSLTEVRSYTQVLADLGRTSGLPALESGRLRPPSPAPSAPPVDLPLKGMRVVEATTRMQGPLAGLLLRMLGADVVKIEPPGGDFGRIVPPLAGDTGSFFLCFNRGKESVELDLAQPSGRSALVELVRDSDVFLHNWRPGKAAEWGLDAHGLFEVNPRLVYAEASGWGDLHQSSGLVGTDFLVQGYSGLGSAIRPENEPPVPTRLIVVDFAGALLAAEGMLRGLYQRERTGRGCKVQTSLLQGAMALQDHVLEALARGHDLPGRRAGRPMWGLLDHPVPTADGLIVLSLEGDGDLKRLGRLCEVSIDALHDRGLLERRVREQLARRSAAYWEERLESVGIPSVGISADESIAAIAHDPHLSHLFEPLAGPALAPRSPWQFSSGRRGDE